MRIAGRGCAFIGIPIAVMMPLPLVVSLIYVPAYLRARRDRAPFVGKGGNLYRDLRVAAMVIGFVLFFLGGIAPPLTLLSMNFLSSISMPVAAVEMALLPFIVSAFIYGGMRLFFRLRRGNMRDYLDYGVILYYVSLTILGSYGFMLFKVLTRVKGGQ